ncbi:hypothetical protein L873DRAFT_206549 [Choiromyces venosus 120613-1]|uniref:Uncharacterized protein n=1 Tax=Choiromyces venosus 120613-1 TaxID=1336337 RepID=A0A3N4J6G3_9PEZI|nr:hypothetical protein L873DRAFT_206549 [Choiromyces venosus 120613-1]
MIILGGFLFPPPPPQKKFFFFKKKKKKKKTKFRLGSVRMHGGCRNGPVLVLDEFRLFYFFYFTFLFYFQGFLGGSGRCRIVQVVGRKGERLDWCFRPSLRRIFRSWTGRMRVDFREVRRQVARIWYYIYHGRKGGWGRCCSG